MTPARPTLPPARTSERKRKKRICARVISAGAAADRSDSPRRMIFERVDSNALFLRLFFGQCARNFRPLRFERHLVRRSGAAGPRIPVTRIADVSFLSVKV